MPTAWSPADLQNLVTVYQPVVYRLALSYTRTITDAEDITQEVFLRLLKAHPSFTDEEHRKAWLLRVTINCCKSHLGSYWRRKVSQFPAESGSNDTEIVVFNGEPSRERRSPEAIQEAHEQQESVLKAVARLPWKQRVCIHLFYFEDASIEMIAQVLSMKPSTVKSHLYRARLTLKATLKEVYDEL
ncbi:MAG: sigma-70 family RNA polymerase sigma factor [Actinomycetia bacterium]|nr:sigma-70 family RNA polymerase sigma factor [Actinomycetes bacterium]